MRGLRNLLKSRGSIWVRYRLLVFLTGQLASAACRFSLLNIVFKNGVLCTDHLKFRLISKKGVGIIHSHLFISRLSLAISAFSGTPSTPSSIFRVALRSRALAPDVTLMSIARLFVFKEIRERYSTARIYDDLSITGDHG